MSHTFPEPTGPSSTPDRLALTVIGIWERNGAAGVSARTVAAEAGVPTSSIYHHFGGMDGLVLCAMEAARTSAASWCALKLDELTGAAGAPRDFAPLLATLIDDWCEQQRPLAFAWCEAQMLGMRDPDRRALTDDWWNMWGDFWGELGSRFGLAALGPVIMMLFEGETSLHLLRWRRPIDRAALEELCAAWSGWLEGRCGEPAAWRTIARDAALRGQQPDPAWDEPMKRIAAAAAATIARDGPAGLTHRAVAREAGTTLGVVSNRFRSSAELLRAAFESIYSRIAVPPSLQEPDVTRQVLSPGGSFPEEANLRASFELTLAAGRDPAYRPFAAQLRYLRGRTSGQYLRGIVHSERTLSIADTALFSSILSGRLRAQLCGRSVENEAVEEMLAPLRRAPA